MHEHLGWSLDLGCKVQNIIVIALFISQSCFVFLLYNNQKLSTIINTLCYNGKILVTKVQIPCKVLKVKSCNLKTYL
jgi:hypothetical protein